MKSKLIVSGIFVVLALVFLIHAFNIGPVQQYIHIGKILKDYGYQVVEVVPGQKGPHDNFKSVEIYKLKDRETVSLYEYSSYYSAKNDLVRLRGPLTDWAVTPHFFWKSRFLIIYVGQDKKIIGDLEKILGKEKM